MIDKTNNNSVLSKQVNSAFSIKLFVNVLLEEIYQGHIGNPNQTKRIVRQTSWINDELNHLKGFLEIFSLQNPRNFSVFLLKKLVAKMIFDFNKLGVVANQMALSRIHQQDSTKEYKQIRILLNSVLHSSSQLYDHLKLLEAMQTSKARMNQMNSAVRSVAGD